MFVWSRIAVWAAALFALLTLEGLRSGQWARFDDPSLTRDLGAVTDVWARWDSVWFLRIAEYGYEQASPAGAAATSFLCIRLRCAYSSDAFGHFVLAGIVISLSASLVAFYLLHRLAEERLGIDGARAQCSTSPSFPSPSS